MIALFLLMGCTSLPRQSGSIPPELLQPCEDVKFFAGKTTAELIGYTTQIIHLYKTCQIREKAIIDVNK